MFKEVSYEVTIDIEVSMLKQFVSMYPPLSDSDPRSHLDGCVVQTL